MSVMHDSSQGAERRAHPRYELWAQVHVKNGSVDYLVELSNISMSGALVDLGTLKAPKWCTLGRAIEVEIIHPETLECVSLRAEIVRINGIGLQTTLGVEFKNPDAKVKDGLRRLLDAARAPRAEEPRRQPPPLPRPVPPPLPV
jgi:hypothetical protein